MDLRVKSLELSVFECLLLFVCLFCAGIAAILFLTIESHVNFSANGAFLVHLESTFFLLMYTLVLRVSPSTDYDGPNAALRLAKELASSRINVNLVNRCSRKTSSESQIV